jgi:glycosyltransferase involved in cell wall biosynthesis
MGEMMKKKPKLLLVAMPNSVHTARWINQLGNSGLDVHLFPSWVSPLHSAARNVTVHELLLAPLEDAARNILIGGGVHWPFRVGGWRFNQLAATRFARLALDQGRWAQQLCHVIRRIEPDIIHTLETQASGYLTLEAKKHFGISPFPKWILTPWGSDLNLFGRLQAHRDRVREVLRNIDFYCPKSDRDIRLAQEYGFTGRFLPMMPGNGGVDVEAALGFWQGPPSGRKLIMLKGYQNWAGRALFGLRALRLIREHLQGFTIMIYATNEDVRIAAELFSQDTGIPTKIIKECPHNEMLALYGRARLSIGISITDGVPNSLIEAMICGAFPVESEGSCASEWIEHGKTGMIVAPEDPVAIAEALRVALTDNELVDRAAEFNVAAARMRIDTSVIGSKAIQMYCQVLKASSI